MTTRVLIVDPLTLLGRELTRCIEDSPDLVFDIDYRHTSGDDEHQIAELGAVPALVPALDGADDTGGAGIVVVTSDPGGDRLGLLEDMAIRRSDLTLIDVARLPELADVARPAVAATAMSGERHHLRVAHPALVVARSLINALEPLGPTRGHLAAVDPVSTYGREALEVLVHQAGRRLQGGDPEQTIDGQVLAFNQVSVVSDHLAEDATLLIPGVPLAVTRTLNGCFHGHVAHLAVELAEPADDPELRDALETCGNVIFADPPFSLDAVPDRDHIFVSQPQLAPDRRIVAVTAMVDGLRLGGALTAVEILRALTVH